MILRDSDAGIGLHAPFAVHPGPELVGHRPQQTLKGRHVGVDPLRSVGHPGPSRAGQRPEAGLDGDQLLGFGGQFLELDLERALLVRSVTTS